MAFKRAFIDINLSVDLDDVAGNFAKAEDFVTFIEQTLKQAIPHYKPEVTTKGITLKPYVWNEDKMEYIQPKLEDETRKPKVGDKTFALEDGEGSIRYVDEHNVDIDLPENVGVNLAPESLVWVESENRWEYGAL